VAAAEGARPRDRSRALGQRGAVARLEGHGVLRIDPSPGENDPEKKVGNFVGGEPIPSART
jgi:hypothetical protein